LIALQALEWHSAFIEVVVCVYTIGHVSTDEPHCGTDL